MAELNFMARRNLKRLAAKGHADAQKHLDLVDARAKRTPVWLRAVVSYQEKTSYGLVYTTKAAVQTVVVEYRGAPGSREEMVTAVLPALGKGLNRGPYLAQATIEVWKVYDTQEAAREGANGP